MSIARMGLFAVLGVALVLAGCESPPAPPPPAPAVSPALRKALLEMVAQAPADAVLVGTFRSPRALVDNLNAFAGPELATLAALPFSLLPPGVGDLEQPVGWTVLIGPDGPGVVFLMHLKDRERLKGETVEGGILKIKPAVGSGPTIFAMRTDNWVAFSTGPAALKAFQAAGPRFAPDEQMADRIAANLAWLRVNAKPLADMALPEIRREKDRLQKKHTAETPSKQVKLFEWLEDLVRQIEDLEVALDADGGHGALRVGLTLRQDASLLAIAKTLGPIETYEVALPTTDRFLLAAWSRIDQAEAGTRLKAFLEPVMDAVFEMMEKAMANQAAGQDAAPPPAVMQPLNKAIKQMWAMIDEQGKVLGDQTAALIEIPEPQQGVYRMTQIVALKDGAAYRALLKKSMETVDGFYKAILGTIPKTPDAPKMDIGIEYHEAAETIEGLSVDVIRFKFDMTPPEDAPPDSPHAAFKAMIDGIYGPEGLVMRVAVSGNRAVVTLGGADVMARAIKNLQAGDADLAKQETVRAALARVPSGSGAVLLVSLPAYGYLVDAMLERVLPMMLPPDAKQGYEEALLPRLDVPTIGEPMLVAVRVDDRTVRLDFDVPASELTRTIPVIRHGLARMMFYGFHAAMAGFHTAMAGQMMSPPGIMDAPAREGTQPQMRQPPAVPRSEPPGGRSGP